MSGLEILAVGPILAVAWLLKQKVATQQQMIDDHEVVISKQQQLLEDLTSHNEKCNDTSESIYNLLKKIKRKKRLMLVAVILFSLWKLKSLLNTERVDKSFAPPPPDYVPTPTEVESEMCNVCFENRKDTLFLPCRHFSACWQCSQNLRNGRCPVCREVIKRAQYVYIT